MWDLLGQRRAVGKSKVVQIIAAVVFCDGQPAVPSAAQAFTPPQSYPARITIVQMSCAYDRPDAL